MKLVALLAHGIPSLRRDWATAILREALLGRDWAHDWLWASKELPH